MKKLIIIVLLLGIALAPVGGGVAFAVETGGNAPQTNGEVNGGCGMFSIGDCITFFIAQMGNMVMTLVSSVLSIAGAALNFSVDLTVNMSAFLAKVKIVDVGWKIMRDIANLFFIFILLWVGIRTILQMGSDNEVRKTLLWVVVMALLINFSLFITKAVVDMGNIATLHFYDAMRPDLYENGQPVKDAQGKQVKAGLSDIYMEGLKMQTFMGSGSSVNNLVATAGGFTNQFIKIGLVTILGSVFFLVAAFVFFAAAFLFIGRAVVLMFLMLLSPLAFAAQVIPSMQGQAKRFWDTLLKQTFFAPLYMALTYVVAKAIQSNGFSDLTNITGNQASFAALLTGEPSDNIGIVVNYIFLIGAMVYTLVIASQGGAYGSKMVIGWGKSLHGWGQGRVTGAAGGVAARALGGLSKAATGGLSGTTSAFGRAALRTADRLQNMKIGGKSYKEMQEKGTFFGVGEEEIERNMKQFKSRPQEQAAYLSRLSEGQRRKAYEKLSARDRVAIERTGVLQQAQINDMYGRLNPEERDKVDEARRKVRQEEGNEQRMATVETITAVPVGTPLTADQITAVTQLRPNQARDLSHEARTNPEIIRRLRPQHLRDLMENGNLLPDEIQAIMNEIGVVGAPITYPAQNAQRTYVQNPANAVLWT